MKRKKRYDKDKRAKPPRPKREQSSGFALFCCSFVSLPPSSSPASCSSVTPYRFSLRYPLRHSQSRLPQAKKSDAGGDAASPLAASPPAGPASAASRHCSSDPRRRHARKQPRGARQARHRRPAPRRRRRRLSGPGDRVDVGLSLLLPCCCYCCCRKAPRGPFRRRQDAVRPLFLPQGLCAPPPRRIRGHRRRLRMLLPDAQLVDIRGAGKIQF